MFGGYQRARLGLPFKSKFISFFLSCGADIGPLDTWRHNEAILPIPSILVIREPSSVWPDNRHTNHDAR